MCFTFRSSFETQLPQALQDCLIRSIIKRAICVHSNQQSWSREIDRQQHCVKILVQQSLCNEVLSNVLDSVLCIIWPLIPCQASFCTLRRQFLNSKDMKGKDVRKNRKEIKVRIKDDTLRLFDCNNNLEIFSYLECSNHCPSHEAPCAIDE